MGFNTNPGLRIHTPNSSTRLALFDIKVSLSHFPPWVPFQLPVLTDQMSITWLLISPGHCHPLSTTYNCRSILTVYWLFSGDLEIFSKTQIYYSWKCSPGSDPEELIHPSLHSHLLCRDRGTGTVSTFLVTEKLIGSRFPSTVFSFPTHSLNSRKPMKLCPHTFNISSNTFLKYQGI